MSQNSIIPFGAIYSLFEVAIGFAGPEPYRETWSGFRWIYFGACPLVGQAAAETVAKMRKSPTLPVCRAAYTNLSYALS